MIFAFSFLFFPPTIATFCSAGMPVNSLFVSPAVTPIKSVLEPYSNNPAYRMYLYDNSDFSILVRMEKVCARLKFNLKKKTFEIMPPKLFKKIIKFIISQSLKLFRVLFHSKS